MMVSNEKFIDDLIRQLVRTAIILKMESSFIPATDEVVAESEILGHIITQYFKNTGREMAETAYAAFYAAGLTVEALPFPSSGAEVIPNRLQLPRGHNVLNGDHNDE